jgi:hypothetical protein
MRVCKKHKISYNGIECPKCSGNSSISNFDLFMNNQED